MNPKSANREGRKFLVGITLLVVFILVVVFGKDAVEAANEAGFFQHTDEFAVYSPPDWWTGEVHYCNEQVRDPQTHQLIATDILTLNCIYGNSEPNIPSRIMNVHYHGRFYWRDTGPTSVMWQCTRLLDYIDCRVAF